MKYMTVAVPERFFRWVAKSLAWCLLATIAMLSATQGQEPIVAEAILRDSFRLHQVANTEQADAKSLEALDTEKPVLLEAWKKLTIGEFEEQAEFKKRVESGRRDEEERYRMQLEHWQGRRDSFVEEIEQAKTANLSTTVGIVAYPPYVTVARWLRFGVQPSATGLPRFDRTTMSFQPIHIASGEPIEIGLPNRADVVGRFSIPTTKIVVRASDLKTAKSFKEQFEGGQIEVIASVEPLIEKLEKPILVRPAFSKNVYDEGAFQRNLFAAFGTVVISELTGRPADNMYYEDVYEKITIPAEYKDGVRFHIELAIVGVELRDRKTGKAPLGVSAAVLNALPVVELLSSDVPGIVVGDQMVAIKSAGLIDSPVELDSITKLRAKEIDLVVRSSRQEIIKEVRGSVDQIQSLPTRTAFRPFRLPERFSTYEIEVVSVAVSPAGHFVASNGWKNHTSGWNKLPDKDKEMQLRVFDVLSGREVLSVDAHYGVLTFSQDSRQITVIGSGLVETWDISTGEKLTSLAVNDKYTGLGVTAIGKSSTAIVSGYGGGVGILDASGGLTVLREPDGTMENSTGLGVSISPDCKSLLIDVFDCYSPAREPAVEVWSLETKKLLRTFTDIDAEALSFNTDSNSATLVANNSVYQLDISDGTLKDEIKLNLSEEMIVGSICIISYDRKVCLATSLNPGKTTYNRDEQICLVSLSDGTLLWSRGLRNGRYDSGDARYINVGPIALAPYGSFAISAFDEDVMFLDLTDRKQ